MKTAIRLGPIAHLQRAKYIGNISNNQAHERKGGQVFPSLSYLATLYHP